MAKYWVAVVLLALCVALPVQAQDGDHLNDEQRAQLAVVNEALANLKLQTSYSMSVETSQLHAVQTASGAGNTITKEFTFEAQVVLDETGRLQSAQGQLQGFAMTDVYGRTAFSFQLNTTTDFRVVDNVLYQRMQVEPLGDTAVNAQLLANLAEWTYLRYGDLTLIFQGEIGAATLELQRAFLPVIVPSDGGLAFENVWYESYPAIIVLDVIELPHETLNGQTMRVFELTLDPYPVMLEAMRRNPEWYGNMAWLDDADPATLQALTELLREYIYNKAQIWVGVDDTLPHRIVVDSSESYNSAAVVTAIPGLEGVNYWPQDDIQFTSSVQGDTTFSAFGETVTVAPRLDARSFFEATSDY